MLLLKPQPVESTKNLRERLERLLLGSPAKNSSTLNQLSFDSHFDNESGVRINHPSQSVASFLNFVTGAVPDGDVYLFGGVLRDLALLGRRGFNSDIDLVVDGNWSHFISYLESLGACKNKFGGYRLIVGNVPVDIWHAEETWAIKNGLIRYRGIASLTETTVLNWDAILMNWRTRTFIFRKNYFEEINARILDVVLEDNPNPLGMAVRVFRHLYLKDAKKITKVAAQYLAKSAKTYTYSEIKNAELRSYRNSIIHQSAHRFFEHLDVSEEKNIRQQYNLTSDFVRHELGLA